MQIGSLVRVRPPFDRALPDVYLIVAVNEITGAFVLAGVGDFDPVHLELVE